MGVEAAANATRGGQLQLLDVVTFNTWIKLREDKANATADFYVKRFSPEYKVAFDAWLKTDPFNNSDAPAGPVRMQEYHNALLEKSAQLSQKATETFAQGAEAREIAEFYVQRSVMLATVLFLTALAQRFKLRKVRIGLVLVAASLLVYQLVGLAMHPRL